MAHTTEAADFTWNRVDGSLHRQAFVAVCVVFLLANSAFSATPVLFSAYLGERHFSLFVAGAIATAESTGLALGSVLSARLIRGAQINVRTVVLCILGMLVVGQLLSAYLHAPVAFGAVRLASGICVGMVQSIGSAWISQFRSSERLFAIYTGTTFLSGTVGIPFFSFTLRHAGLAGSFLTFAGLISLAMLIASLYPRHLSAHASEEHTHTATTQVVRHRYALGLLLAAVVVNFAFNGGIWTFLDQLGLRAGIDSAKVSFILSAGMFTALGVSAAAGAIGNRYRGWGPLLCAHACLIVSSLGLLFPSFLPFACAVILFHIGLAVISPYFLSALAAIKPAERSVLFGVAAMNVGFGIGPWLVSVTVQSAGYAATLLTSAALFAGSLALVLVSSRGREAPSNQRQ